MAKTNPLFGLFEEVVGAVLNAAPSSPPRLPTGNFFDPDRPIRYADMFCGIGGFHAAANAIGGMECVFACDVDEDCRRAYEANYGIRPQGDIARVDPQTVPDHDLLFAGFPCQPFSIIGSMGGFADARGTLFFELAKIIQAKRPTAFVLENVRQLSSHNEGKTLKRILEILHGLGYWVKHEVLNALNFGLPQKRERILIVGFKAEKVDGFSFPKTKIEMRPLSEILEEKVDERHYVSERIKRSRQEQHAAKVKPAIWHENKAGNISSHPFSCALRAGASYNYLLVDGERRLTSREMLRLQGFPESFKVVVTEGQMRKQAGNAVPVPMVQAVIQQVLHARRIQTARERQAA